MQNIIDTGYKYPQIVRSHYCGEKFVFFLIFNNLYR